MNTGSKIKTYKREYPYSYTIGTFPTIELITHQNRAVRELLIHSKYREASRLRELSYGIPITLDDRAFTRLAIKESSLVLGVFEKYPMELDGFRPHIVLVNPTDMGNLGTILRTVLGFGYQDAAIITPAADFWNPKTIRASMGALFQLRIQCFSSFQEYRKRFSQHSLYPFMLGAELLLLEDTCPKAPLFSLIFGNEATGLDRSFFQVGQPIRIPQTSCVDSLNLAVCAGIGAYTFALKNGLLKEGYPR